MLRNKEGRIPIERLEQICNYLRVCRNADEIFMFDIDRDRIGYFEKDNTNAHCRDISSIYAEMLDKQNEVQYNKYINKRKVIINRKNEQTERVLFSN